jgi:hypothetical protein
VPSRTHLGNREAGTMDDPFDTQDVIGHSSVTGSTVAGLQNYLEFLLGYNIKWQTLDNLATLSFIHHRGGWKETNWVKTKPNCRHMWEILTMHNIVHYTKIAKFKALE